MFDFDMFPDMGDGLFAVPENKDCKFCDDSGNEGDYGNVSSANKKQVLAMGYVPYQEFNELYDDYSEALDNGSLFVSLVKPFYGGKGER